ncbi:uncharacterized protein N7500_009370 [Penicillium coprophilum]|uniref:uncharacterized protein n=1 Tax=Penicillium coprophilum TaxID=36646 RepID=UPI0023A3AD71|nr:uncharacterized protein N7500_009370 [Penicillium coprophilum]KAJ5153931.1 hypothetical protein N7500_009370 [Penicillium coprophilum]
MLRSCLGRLLCYTILSERHSLIPPASITSAKFLHALLGAACPAPSALSEGTCAQPLILQSDSPLPRRKVPGAQLLSSSMGD